MIRSAILIAMMLVTFAAVALADGAKVKCAVCNMHIDTGHRIHYKLDVKGQGEIHVGSLSCAKSVWAKHKDAKIAFYGQDFVTGDWVDASKGHFLIESSLKIGTGMDTGGAAVLFADPTMAAKGKSANGGRVVALQVALQAVAR